MEKLTITSDHIAAARLAGACSEAGLYRPGTAVEKIRSDHLEWYAERFPAEATAAAKEIMAGSALVCVGAPPLALFGYGYGSGSGDGYGSGYGDGDGYGSGSGSGYGYGSGSGDGYGSGYGSGSGSGDGYGSGRSANA